MSKSDSMQVRVNKKFIKNLNELYPQETSFNKKTKKLNSILEEMLYGKKNER